PPPPVFPYPTLFRSYDLLDELYGNAVGQWGRYNNHVAAIIGGAVTWERYGTAPRFEPLDEARQRAAMDYLNRIAFRVPEMFLNPAILRRMEQEGVVNRIRNARGGVPRPLVTPTRPNRHSG